ncbi:MAG: FAD-binding oxidoreductase [Mycobacterium sp.]
MTRVVDSLLSELPGIVHLPGSAEYSAATTPDNASYRQQPGAVVRPSSAAEVARAIACVDGRAGLVVQATGHGAGQPIASADVLLDTSGLNRATVDSTARIARVGGGAVWPTVQEAAAPHGVLGLSGTSPTVGVAGYTFGGGVGWLVRKYGLAAAALRSVEYVDGSARIRVAAADAPDPVDREALWAFRGGAPVGVATSLEIGLFEVPELWTGYLLWPAADLKEVAAAWATATAAVSDSVTSALSLLHVPPRGPFPDELLGTTVVHLSYASPDGGTPLDPMRDAVRGAATPVVDTTAPGDVASLSAIHLDPPAAVPARGTGRWLGSGATDVLVDVFEAAHVGQPGGLSMIEVRHTDSAATDFDGALTSVPSPFLLHAVGTAPDDDARRRTDDVLRAVEAAGRNADVGRAAPSFREGQPDAADAMPAADRDRLNAVTEALDPRHVLRFHRHVPR